MPSVEQSRKKNKQARRHRRRRTIYPHLFKTGVDKTQIATAMEEIYCRLAVKERRFLEDYMEKLLFMSKVADQLERMGAYQGENDEFHFPSFAADSDQLKAYLCTTIQKYGTEEEREALLRQCDKAEKEEKPAEAEEVDDDEPS